MKFRNKLAISVATASLAMTSFLVAPQAVAHSKAERMAIASDKKVRAMEAQMNQMSSMMQSMQSELARVKQQPNKVQELEQWVESQKNKPAPSKDNMFIVRGGWSHFNDNRGSTASTVGSGIGIDLLTSEVDQDAFYYGGAFNHNVNNDLFGLMENTSFQIEFGIEYTELGDREVNGLGTALTALHGTPGLSSVTVNMLRVNASPKIKFFHGSKFRPWIIPLGIDFNIISPPSDAVTVLNTGMNFGVGADYEIFKDIALGVDGRYHWTPDDVDGVDTDGFTLGGYIGFAF